jgi:hypothetical protein
MANTALEFNLGRGVSLVYIDGGSDYPAEDLNVGRGWWCVTVFVSQDAPAKLLPEYLRRKRGKTFRISNYMPSRKHASAQMSRLKKWTVNDFDKAAFSRLLFYNPLPTYRNLPVRTVAMAGVRSALDAFRPVFEACPSPVQFQVVAMQFTEGPLDQPDSIGVKPSMN